MEDSKLDPETDLEKQMFKMIRETTGAKVPKTLARARQGLAKG